MEPPAGGVSAEAVRIALAYGYGPGTGARFISFPTHHTRHVATQERRPSAHIEACFAVPEAGPLPDPLREILDLVAEADVVLNTGHISAPEAVRLVEAAKAAGVTRILVPSSHYAADEVRAIVGLGAYVEFSYFFVSPATQIGLTHVDAEAHIIPAATVPGLVSLIRAAGYERAIVSSDCGVGVLPVPIEGLRSFLMLLAAAGVARADLRRMVADNPLRLFRVIA